MSTRPRLSPAAIAGPLTRAILVCALTAGLAPAAQAQSVTVTASLDATDGLARPGAYVPVRLRISNGSGESFSNMTIRSGGPVEISAPLVVAPGQAADVLRPVYYAGGDLHLVVEFLVAGSGGRTVRPDVTDPAVRPLPDETALVAVAPGAADPDEALQKSLRDSLSVKSLRLVRMTQADLALARACGVLDAVVGEEVPGAAGRTVVLRGGGRPIPRAIAAWPLPIAIEEPVQPEAWRLLTANVWPASDRLRLWLWLGVLALAVAATGALVPRRRVVVAAGVLVLVGAAGAAVIWQFGNVRLARLREARVFYVRDAAPLAALEHLAMAESRGGQVVRLEVQPAGDAPLPLPMPESAQDLYRPLGTLRLDDAGWVFDSTAPQTLLHVLAATGEWPTCQEAAPAGRETLAKLAARSDFIAGVRVAVDRGTDVAGRSQTIDAWAVEWQSSADPDVAFAGRSLAWWNQARREGDAPFVLTWWHDEPPAGRDWGAQRERLPALVVHATAP